MTDLGAVERCAIVGYPAPLERDDYALAAAEIEESLAALPGAVAVYRIGSVSAPGISDLDRVLVLGRPLALAPLWSRVSASTRAVAMHGPFVVDRETFARHRWFALLQPLEIAWGTAVEVESPPAAEYLSVLHAAEGLVVALLRMHKQIATARIKARSTLCIFHSLRHSLQLASVSEQDCSPVWEVMEETQLLRRDWFGLDRPQQERRLRRLVAVAIPGIVAALESLPAREADRELQGGPGFKNITLVPAGPGESSHMSAASAVSPALARRSRRIGEIGWRLRRGRLFLPERAVGWLLPPASGPDQAVRIERDRIVANYRAFLRATGPGASSIGLTPGAGR